MKSLKNYIKNYIDESVWDIENNIEDDNKELILNDIKKFIDDNYGGLNIDRCKFIFDEKKDKYVINCNQPVILKIRAKQLTNGLFEWGEVKSLFDCSGSPITSLEGAPKHVDGGFDCSKCPKLESLEGAPKWVGATFDCRECDKLENLKGSPEYVGWSFRCSKCPKLKSLKGACLIAPNAL